MLAFREVYWNLRHQPLDVGVEMRGRQPNGAPGKGSTSTGDRDLIRILEHRVSSPQTVDRSQQ